MGSRPSTQDEAINVSEREFILLEGIKNNTSKEQTEEKNQSKRRIINQYMNNQGTLNKSYNLYRPPVFVDNDLQIDKAKEGNQ